ncbi:type II toxin-antitoxin system RelE/ParE family toxin [Pontibacter sp. 172403-2]|uniref:type II toxin-antitoxin system RelE/ParE family toxin n=1 Tax=Pontibacter rufus TaxID=2791028 RepID=UPI0018AF93C6|nr:type II toxin-antitoxin system RelE/ParE family toxin [Pontibacter sp. 172403-2]MBF9255624.1 type II toxin-antitoxin system RelE/ParE family toxin [Pontibacter sp. 172403-2]
MAIYQLSPAAEEDLTEIWLYLAENASEQVADHIIDEISDTCQHLAQSPLIGRTRNELREELRSFPASTYLIFYDVVTANHIVVRRVLHQRRDVDTLLGA